MSASHLVRVQSLAADLFGLPPERFTPETRPEDVEGWDSMQTLNLVLSLEQEFGVQIGPDEIARMTSVSAIVDVVDTLEAHRRSSS